MDKTAHLYKMSCWQTASGAWHVNDVTNLSGTSAKWYTPMRILNLSIEDYVNLLIEFKAKRLRYYKENDYLAFSFNREIDAKNFCSYINKKAKSINYYCL